MTVNGSKHGRACVWVAALICCAAVRPAAGHRLEPINTEYAQPFAPGVGVLKLGYGHNQFEEPREDEADLSLEYGLLPRLQFSVDEAHLWRNGGGGRQRSGFANPELGLRYLLAGGAGRSYAVSLSPSYTPVIGSRAVREGISSYGLGVNADYYGKPGWLFFSNLGFEQASQGEDGESRERRVFYRLAAVRNLTYRWSPTVELLGEHDVGSGRHDVTLVPEIQYFKSQWMELKLGLPVKLTHGAGRLGIQFQLTFGIGKGSHG
jgi:hypothetical protein